MNLPPLYIKVLNLIKQSETTNRNRLEGEVARNFRLSMDDVEQVFKDFEAKGLIERKDQRDVIVKH